MIHVTLGLLPNKGFDATSERYQKGDGRTWEAFDRRNDSFAGEAHVQERELGRACSDTSFQMFLLTSCSNAQPSTVWKRMEGRRPDIMLDMLDALQAGVQVTALHRPHV